jgi:hypothetical protein
MTVTAAATNFYLNGVAGVGGSGITNGSNTQDLLIGTSYSTPCSTDLDEVQIFSRALLQSEIADIYNAGRGGKCKPVINPSGAQYCIFGPSTGVGWTWTLGSSGPFSVPPVAVPGTAIQLATRWVANMTSNGVTATQLTGSQAHCFTISPGGQILTVDGCQVTSNQNGCTFNPTVIEVVAPPIPTVSEWGLVVLTLVLLIGAKIYFARRRTATA